MRTRGKAALTSVMLNLAVIAVRISFPTKSVDRATITSCLFGDPVFKAIIRFFIIIVCAAPSVLQCVLTFISVCWSSNVHEFGLLKCLFLQKKEYVCVSKAIYLCFPSQVPCQSCSFLAVKEGIHLTSIIS